jgi:hypothetical protein
MLSHYNIVSLLTAFSHWNVFKGLSLKIAGIYPFGYVSGTVALLGWVNEVTLNFVK